MDGKTVKVFDILGLKIRLNTDKLDINTSPEEIVDYVREVVEKIQQNNPGLNNGQIFLLATLKIAEKRMELSREYKENVNIFQSSLIEALDFIDQAIPAQ